MGVRVQLVLCPIPSVTVRDLCRLQVDILRLFGRYKAWGSIPKFINMRKYSHDIRQYGMTDLTTTGPKESYVKTVRAAWQFTNKRPETLQQQVI
jgi:hypothetical protein